MLIFRSAPCHHSPQSPPLWLQTGFHNNHYEKVRMRNYKPERTSDFLHCLIFPSIVQWKKLVERSQFKRQFFPKDCVIFFFSQHNATEIHKDLLCDYRRGFRTSRVAVRRYNQNLYLKYYFEKLWMRNYKRARISDTFPFWTFFSWK